jgi:type III secretion system FlhB-like substrate exporter
MVEEIMTRVASGHSLRKIASDPEMPCTAAMLKWLEKDAEFAGLYARAKESAADLMAEEICEIADDLTEDANSRRVRVDARKWIAAKLKPRSYGDRVEQHLSGTVGLNIAGALAALNSKAESGE